jgi:DNA-binding transcriptional regulator YiaG
MSGETNVRGQPERHWTPHLIKRLRGKRTQAEFGALIGVPKNTVWRWEAGQTCPDARHAAHLSELASTVSFLPLAVAATCRYLP